MSLIAMLEGCKDVAFNERERLAAQAAEDVAEFEEFGADLAAAYDAEEIAAAEEALKLAEEFDEREEAEMGQRAADDLALAKEMLSMEISVEEACSQDELMAQQMEAQEKEEALRVAKLEARERKLAHKKLTKDDLSLAHTLANEIETEESYLRELERKDRKLAHALVKEEGKVLATMPQTEEKLRSMSKAINGENVSMRTKLRAKLNGMRKGLSDLTNSSVQTGVDGMFATGR